MAQQYEDFDANLAGEEGKTEETKTRWFKRIKKDILTPSSEKKGSSGKPELRSDFLNIL